MDTNSNDQSTQYQAREWGGRGDLVDVTLVRRAGGIATVVFPDGAQDVVPEAELVRR